MVNLKNKIKNHPFFKNINNLLIIFILSLVIIFYFIMKNIVPIRENFYELTAAEIEKFKKELEDSKKKVIELTAELEKINKEHSELKTSCDEDITKLKTTIDNLEGINAKSTNKKNILRDEIKMLTDEYKTKIKNLESKLKKNRQSSNKNNFTNIYRDNFQNTEDGSTEGNSNDTNTTTTARPTRQPLPSKIQETIINISKIKKLTNKLKEHDAIQNEKLQNLQERFNKYNTSN